MSKKKKLETLSRMFEEMDREEWLGGFSEYDQSEIEFLHGVLVNHLTVEGIELYMNWIEETTRVGINRKRASTKEDMIKSIKR